MDNRITLEDIISLIDADMIYRIKCGGITQPYKDYYSKLSIPDVYLDQPVMEISGGEDSCGEFVFIRLPAIAGLLEV